MKNRFSAFLWAGAVLTVAACTPGPSGSDTSVDASDAAVEEIVPTPPSVAPTVADAGPAGADAMTWIYDRGGEGGRPRLRYVNPQTSESAIRLECVVGGAIYIYLDRPAPAGDRPEDWPFTIISGDLPSSSPGDTVARGDRLDVIGAFPITDDVLTRFRNDGTMAVTDSVLSTPLPVDAIEDGERAMAKQFFAACESK